MGKLIYHVAEPNSKPFSDSSILDACIDPQYNGIFPDDPALGIVSERKANATDSRTSQYTRRSKDNKTEHHD